MYESLDEIFTPSPPGSSPQSFLNFLQIADSLIELREVLLRKDATRKCPPPNFIFDTFTNTKDDDEEIALDPTINDDLKDLPIFNVDAVALTEQCKLKACVVCLVIQPAGYLISAKVSPFLQD